jgi:hypothetical protein
MNYEPFLALSQQEVEKVKNSWKDFHEIWYCGFQVLAAGSLKVTAIWDIAPCSLGVIDRLITLMMAAGSMSVLTLGRFLTVAQHVPSFVY